MAGSFDALVDRAVDDEATRRRLGVHTTAEETYTSKFLAWERRSSVRAKPRRVLADLAEEERLGRVFFPPELVAALEHPLLAGLGPDEVRRILIHRLHIYLEFTAELEQTVVNPMVQQISRRRSGFELPETMVEDAYKIYTDEAWHAQFSDDLQRQIHKATGVGPCLPETPRFLHRLHATEAAMDERSRALAAVFFTIVSETLISAVLSDIPRDKRVVGPVRELVADHAIDEGRHHAYFSQLLRSIWPQLNARERAAVGPVLPEFILAFLEPDVAATACMLAECGLEREQAKQVIWELYHPDRSRPGIRKAAQKTVDHLRHCGVLDEPGTLEAFQRAELVTA